MVRSNGEAQSPLTVDEEYNKALHSKSFINIWKKAHRHLKRTISTTSPKDEEEDCNTQISPLSSASYAHLPDFLLEPNQDTLLMTAEDSSCSGRRHSRLHRFIVEYFDTTRDACDACAALLASIDRTRAHRRSLRRLLGRLSDSTLECSTFSKLASLVQLDNPLSGHNLAQFHRTHALYGPLLRRLIAARKSIVRYAQILRVAKKATGYALIAACGVVVMAVGAVVVAVHLPVVLQAAARWVTGRAEGGSVERAAAEVDSAAKGAYIIGMDLDTVSWMVRRVHDEVEHGRDVVRLVLRNRERQLVREVAREVDSGEVRFSKQVAELEEHVYLCLLTINQSRKLVAKEMGGGGGGAPPPSAVVV